MLGTWASVPTEGEVKDMADVAETLSPTGSQSPTGSGGPGGEAPFASAVQVNRVLDRSPVETLDQYVVGGGGEALTMARRVGADKVLEVIAESGLRGRGGAGFPTSTKWETVAAAHSADVPTTVVINAAEGEPGTFKDRALIRRNPYRILEGALIAAEVVGAATIRIGTKATFVREVERLRSAIEEIAGAGWCGDIRIEILLGPNEYLFGEETAMLEVVEGRQPFPRVTPPFRRGIVEHGDRRSAAGTHMAVEGGSDEAPALVGNVETLANVPLIVSNGPDWFRECGTEASPGTIVCTVTGDVRRAAVGEFPMGTSLAEVIEHLSWGTRSGLPVGVIVPGTANAMIPGADCDVALTYEAMSDAGSGLGSAGFIVFDTLTEPLDIALGISKFLSVESCGQCQPCKSDGLAISSMLTHMRNDRPEKASLDQLRTHMERVTDGARCNLAYQIQAVVQSLLERFPESIERAGEGYGAATHRAVPMVAEILDIVAGRAVLDESQRRKQPDWSIGSHDSGRTPAERLENTPVHITRTDGARSLSVDSGASVEPLIDPAEVLNNSHDEIHAALLACIDGSAGTTTVFRHMTKAHLDAISRILYPTVELHGTDDDVGLARRSEERVHLVLAMLDGLHLHEDDVARRTAVMRAIDTELRQIHEDTSMLIGALSSEMDPNRLDDLAEGLVEANASSPA